MKFQLAFFVCFLAAASAQLVVPQVTKEDMVEALEGQLEKMASQNPQLGALLGALKALKDGNGPAGIVRGAIEGSGEQGKQVLEQIDNTEGRSMGSMIRGWAGTAANMGMKGLMLQGGPMGAAAGMAQEIANGGSMADIAKGAAKGAAGPAGGMVEKLMNSGVQGILSRNELSAIVAKETGMDIDKVLDIANQKDIGIPTGESLRAAIGA